MNTKPFDITQIDYSINTQFRVEREDTEHSEHLATIADSGEDWSTPIRIARYNGKFHIGDGHHRVAAYLAQGEIEIPAGQYVVVDCSSEEEVELLGLRANTDHGKPETPEDRIHKVNFLVGKYRDKYVKGCTVDVAEIMKALKLSESQARRAVLKKNAELEEEAEQTFQQMYAAQAKQKDIVAATGWSAEKVRLKWNDEENVQKSQNLQSVKDGEGEGEDTPHVPVNDDVMREQPTKLKVNTKKLQAEVIRLRMALAEAIKACEAAGADVPAE